MNLREQLASIILKNYVVNHSIKYVSSQNFRDHIKIGYSNTLLYITPSYKIKEIKYVRLDGVTNILENDMPTNVYSFSVMDSIQVKEFYSHLYNKTWIILK